jgi:hypothetical protein
VCVPEITEGEKFRVLKEELKSITIPVKDSCPRVFPEEQHMPFQTLSWQQWKKCVVLLVIKNVKLRLLIGHEREKHVSQSMKK